MECSFPQFFSGWVRHRSSQTRNDFLISGPFGVAAAACCCCGPDPGHVIGFFFITIYHLVVVYNNKILKKRLLVVFFIWFLHLNLSTKELS